MLINIFDAVIATTAVLAFLVAVVTTWANLGQLRAMQTARKVENLLSIMQRLHDPELREARAIVRDPDWDGKDEVAARMICSSFDFAALLLQHDLVDQKIFLAYWGPALCDLGDALDDFLRNRSRAI